MDLIRWSLAGSNYLPFQGWNGIVAKEMEEGIISVSVLSFLLMLLWSKLTKDVLAGEENEYVPSPSRLGRDCFWKVCNPPLKENVIDYLL